MKLIYISILFLIISLTGLFAQAPILSISKKIVNLGAVNVGITKSDSVIIKNIGTDTLMISSVTYFSFFSDGFNFGSVPSYLVQGDSAIIGVSLKPNYWGLKTGGIILTHNSISLSDTITIIGEGMQAVLGLNFFNPEIIHTFSSYFNSTTHKVDSFRVKNMGNLDLKIKTFSTNPYFSVSPESVYVVSVNSLALQVPIYVKVSFNPDSVNSQQSGFIMLQHNGSTKLDSIYVVGDAATEVANDRNELSLKYSLHQNYPNPFNPSTTISFSLPYPNKVSLKVYTVLGQEVSTIINGVMQAGNHSVQFDANSLSGGIYFYRLIAGEYVQTKSFVLLK
jgi:hypothetical protein